MDQTTKMVVTVVVIIVIGVIGYSIMTMPDKRSTVEKIGDAIHEMPQGAEKAERQLEDRTPGQKLGDAVKDTGDKIKDSTSSP